MLVRSVSNPAYLLELNADLTDPTDLNRLVVLIFEQDYLLKLNNRNRVPC